MNIVKWIDDVRSTFRLHSEANGDELPQRSRHVFNEGGYTTLEYLSHSEKAGETAGLFIGTEHVADRPATNIRRTRRR
jgi:hypothetical protein